MRFSMQCDSSNIITYSGSLEPNAKNLDLYLIIFSDILLSENDI